MLSCVCVVFDVVTWLVSCVGVVGLCVLYVCCTCVCFFEEGDDVVFDCV